MLRLIIGRYLLILSSLVTLFFSACLYIYVESRDGEASCKLSQCVGERCGLLNDAVNRMCTDSINKNLTKLNFNGFYDRLGFMAVLLMLFVSVLVVYMLCIVWFYLFAVHEEFYQEAEKLFLWSIGLSPLSEPARKLQHDFTKFMFETIDNNGFVFLYIGYLLVPFSVSLNMINLNLNVIPNRPMLLSFKELFNSMLIGPEYLEATNCTKLKYCHYDQMLRCELDPDIELTRMVGESRFSCQMPFDAALVENFNIFSIFILVVALLSCLMMVTNWTFMMSKAFRGWFLCKVVHGERMEKTLGIDNMTDTLHYLGEHLSPSNVYAIIHFYELSYDELTLEEIEQIFANFIVLLGEMVRDRDLVVAEANAVVARPNTPAVGRKSKGTRRNPGAGRKGQGGKGRKGGGKKRNGGGKRRNK